MKRYTGIHKDFLYILIISIMSMYYSKPAPPNKKDPDLLPWRPHHLLLFACTNLTTPLGEKFSLDLKCAIICDCHLFFAVSFLYFFLSILREHSKMDSSGLDSCPMFSFPITAWDFLTFDMLQKYPTPFFFHPTWLMAVGWAKRIECWIIGAKSIPPSMSRQTRRVPSISINHSRQDNIRAMPKSIWQRQRQNKTVTVKISALHPVRSDPIKI